MNSPNCPTRREFADYLVGSLAEDKAERLEKHLDECEPCEDTIAKMENLSDTAIEALRTARPTADDEVRADPVFVAAVGKLHAMRPASDVSTGKEARRRNDPFADVDALEQLGNYRLVERIGQGGMGVVYQAVHTRLEKPVALKILPVDQLRNPDIAARFEQEMKAIGKLNHANLVCAHDAGESLDGRFLYLAMELVEGIDVGRLAERVGPLPITDACEIVRQAAIGLAYVHRQGLVHRDVKPSNLMLAKGESPEAEGRRPKEDDPQASVPSAYGLRSSAPLPTVKLLDLGLALLDDNAGDELTAAGQMMGTLDYMAPEQAGDAHAVDHRADIYSLGCTLYKLLAGKAPFADDRYKTVVQKTTAHAQAPVPSLADARADIPHQLVELVDRMLAKDPADRFTTASEVADKLRPFVEGSDLGALGVRAFQATSASELISAVRGSTYEPQSSADVDTQPSVDGERPAPVVTRVSSIRRLMSTRTAIIAISAVLVLVAAGIVFRLMTDRGELVIDCSDPGIKVAITRSGKTVEEMELRQGENAITLWSGEYQIEVSPQVEEIRIEKESVTLTRNGREVVRIYRESESRHQVGGKAPPLAVAPFDSAEAKQHQRAWAEHLGVPVEITNSIEMKLTLIPAGEFLMGSRKSAEQLAKIFAVKVDVSNEYPLHSVRITQPFWLGQHEITVGQFRTFVEAKDYETDAERDGEGGFGFNPRDGKVLPRDATFNWQNTGFTQTDDHPVVNVTWNDAVEFCRWLSHKETREYRLPTEAEWEYACRAGTVSLWWFGNEPEGLAQVANVGDGTAWEKFGWDWCISNKDGVACAAPVGSFEANPFGLYDMHGNVWEWCADWYGAYYSGASPTLDPSGPRWGERHTARGGCWENSPKNVRSANRLWSSGTSRHVLRGFRVAMSTRAL